MNDPQPKEQEPIDLQPPIPGQCPACGSKNLRLVIPVASLTYGKDRICLDCQTRFSPATPRWAALVFLLVGFVFFIPGTAALLAAAFHFQDWDLAQIGVILIPLGLPAVIYGVTCLLSRQQTIIVAAPPALLVDSGHRYRLAYRVTEDHRTDPRNSIAQTLIGFGVMGVVLMILIVTLTKPEDRSVALVGVSATLMVFTLLYLLWWYLVEVRSYLKHLRCQHWFQNGDFEVLEGKTEIQSSANVLVSDSELARTVCLVGPDRIEWSNSKHSPGFRGEFTAAESQVDALGSGLQVRIAHHGAYLLQIEIVEADEWKSTKSRQNDRKRKKRKNR